MHTETGQLVDWKEVEKMDQSQKDEYIPVNRDLTVIEARNMQIKRYSPCACGSGRKFKFCCYKKS